LFRFAKHLDEDGILGPLRLACPFLLGSRSEQGNLECSESINLQDFDCHDKSRMEIFIVD